LEWDLFSDYRQVSFYTGSISEKVVEIKIVQIAHKIPIWNCISAHMCTLYHKPSVFITWGN